MVTLRFFCIISSWSADCLAITS